MSGISGRLAALGAMVCVSTLAIGCGKSGGTTTPAAPYISIDLDSGERTEHAAVPADLLTNDAWKTTHMVMKLIPAGSFEMGDQSDPPVGLARELPVHTVNITQPFYLGVFEVTQRQWFEIKGDWPSNFASDPTSTNEMRPVEQVSWDDINDPSTGFTDIANALPSLPSDLTFRLPTEAEWEYAAKAGMSTNYSYGNAADGAYMWYGDNNDPNGTKEVGTMLPNPWGLYDMHGNVWEWVQDGYSATYYQYCVDSSIEEDPQGPASGSNRVRRGGMYLSNADDCRSAYRSSILPSIRSNNVGFRVVAALAGP